MKRLAALIYVALLHMLLIAAVWRPGIFYRTGAPSSGLQSMQALQQPPPIIATMRVVHQQTDDSVPDGVVIFLGDSITMALATAAITPLAVNYGIGSQRSDELIESMKAYRSMRRAKAIVVAIGANDLLQSRDAGIDQRYRDILSAIPAGTPVVVSSVTPLPRLDAVKVADVREAAAVACAGRKGCTFVDALSLLSHPTSLLQDQVHLSPAGYALWIAALRHALNETAKSPRVVARK